DANGNPRLSSQLVEQATRFRRELGQARVFDDRGQGSIVVEQQSQLLAAAVGGQQWTERILSESVHEPASTRTAEWPLVGGLSPTDASVSLAITSLPASESSMPAQRKILLSSTCWRMCRMRSSCSSWGMVNAWYNVSANSSTA